MVCNIFMTKDSINTLLQFLQCPITGADLSYDEGRNMLLVQGHDLAYPIKEGIPVLLESEVVKLGSAPDSSV